MRNVIKRTPVEAVVAAIDHGSRARKGVLIPFPYQFMAFLAFAKADRGDVIITGEEWWSMCRRIRSDSNHYIILTPESRKPEPGVDFVGSPVTAMVKAQKAARELQDGTQREPRIFVIGDAKVLDACVFFLDFVRFSYVERLKASGDSLEAPETWLKGPKCRGPDRDKDGNVVIKKRSGEPMQPELEREGGVLNV